MRSVLGTAAFLLLLGSASAVPRKVVSVGAPAINCVFDPTCKIEVALTTPHIPLPVSGPNIFESRTFAGVAGAPANGLCAYMYRIDLSYALAMVRKPCIASFTIDFGPVVSTLDFDGDGTPDQVFVVTSGGLGKIGIVSAEQTGNAITFTLAEPLCSGGPLSHGQSSLFVGLVSKKEAVLSVGRVKETDGTVHRVEVRVPRK